MYAGVISKLSKCPSDLQLEITYKIFDSVLENQSITFAKDTNKKQYAGVTGSEHTPELQVRYFTVRRSYKLKLYAGVTG